MQWLAFALTQGPGTSVTPVDAATTSITGYIVGYGPLGIIALAMAFLLYKGWRLTSPAREAEIRAQARTEARTDLEAELGRTIARAGKAEQQRDDLSKASTDQLVPLLVQFTAATQSLLPLLQELVRRRENGRT